MPICELCDNECDTLCRIDNEAVCPECYDHIRSDIQQAEDAARHYERDAPSSIKDLICDRPNMDFFFDGLKTAAKLHEESFNSSTGYYSMTIEAATCLVFTSKSREQQLASLLLYSAWNDTLDICDQE